MYCTSTVDTDLLDLLLDRGDQHLRSRTRRGRSRRTVETGRAADQRDVDDVVERGDDRIGLQEGRREQDRAVRDLLGGDELRTDDADPGDRHVDGRSVGLRDAAGLEHLEHRVEGERVDRERVADADPEPLGEHPRHERLVRRVQRRHPALLDPRAHHLVRPDLVRRRHGEELEVRLETGAAGGEEDDAVRADQLDVGHLPDRLDDGVLELLQLQLDVSELQLLHDSIDDGGAPAGRHRGGRRNGAGERDQQRRGDRRPPSPAECGESPVDRRAHRRRARSRTRSPLLRRSTAAILTRAGPVRRAGQALAISLS